MSTIWPLATCLMQMECSFSTIVLNMSLAFSNENIQSVKVMTRKLYQNESFQNGDITIQICIVRELLNILAISLLSRVHGTSGYFEMQKEYSCHFMV